MGVAVEGEIAGREQQSLAVPDVCDTATRDRSNKFKISNEAMNLLFMMLLQNKPDRILIDNGVSNWTALIEDG